MRTALSGLAFALMLAFAAQAHAAEIDWTKVDAALVKTASLQGGVHRYGFPRTDLQVTLSEIRPDGQEVYIQSGWLRASHRKIDPQASSILRPVQSHLEPDAADLPAGQFVEARVELFPFAHVFRAGSRVRLSVESPGGDRALWKFDVLPADGQVINTIGHTAAAPSRIVLPVVPGIEVTTPLPPCPGLRAQPCRAYEELSNTPG